MKWWLLRRGQYRSTQKQGQNPVTDLKSFLSWNYWTLRQCPYLLYPLVMERFIRSQTSCWIPTERHNAECTGQRNYLSTD